MEFGVVFTAHPNPIEEPYPHCDAHARTTGDVVGRDKAMRSLDLLAERVIPAVRPPAGRVAGAA